MRVLASAALIALTVSACSVSVGGASVSSDDLEEQVSTRLAEAVGRTPEKVECPDSLDAEVGAEVRCTLTDSGESWGITVTVTEVNDGNRVVFDAVVDDEPLEGSS